MTALRRAAPTLAALPSPRLPCLAACGDDARPRADDRARRLPAAEASDRRRSAARSRCRRIATSPTAARSRFRSRCCRPTRCTRAPIRCSSSPAVPGQAASFLGPFAARTDRRAQGSRHRARRPARHRPLVAARLRGVQARPQPRGGARVRSRAEGDAPARASSPRRASMPRNTRRRRGSPTSRRCARRSATTRSTSGAAPTARASRRNICAGIPTACAASCSTASRRRR